MTEIQSPSWLRDHTPGTGRVEAILRSSLEGAPMESLGRVRILTGGLQGDRYQEGRGRWSSHRWDPVTLIAKEDVDAAAAVLDIPLDPSLLRRNLVTEGVDLGSFVGRRFEVGDEVVLEGVRPCAPCRYLEKLLDIRGLKGALRGRGGLRARVLREGMVSRGARLRPFMEPPKNMPARATFS